VSDRLDELAANLAAVHERIARACAAVGRAPEEVTLIAVTKTFPAQDVRRLVELGVHDVGENRDQEAAAKAAACRGLDVRWHFVGRLQRNKAHSVVTYADVVHSVDSPRLVDALATASRAAGRAPACLLQVSLDGDPARGGALPADLPALAHRLVGAGLELRGFMAVAPLTGDPDAAFAGLWALAERLRADHPTATWVSAGMSADLEAAVAHGATHVRVGSAVLGRRPALG